MSKQVLVSICGGVVLGWALGTYMSDGTRVEVRTANDELTRRDQAVCLLPHRNEPPDSLPVANTQESREPLSTTPSGIDSDSPPSATKHSVWDEVFSDSPEVPTPEELERRFGGLDLQGVLAARAGIGWAMELEGHRVFDEKYALGIYETAAVMNGQGPIQMAPEDGSMRGTQVRIKNAPGGGVEAQVIEALPSDSPFMAARYEEWTWLNGRKAALETAASGK